MEVVLYYIIILPPWVRRLLPLVPETTLTGRHYLHLPCVWGAFRA
jgi:hypothetical protein